tara:strand:+ start:632 stop:838 length:207 start_codon:yes stop_codon:yes gene_type:complete
MKQNDKIISGIKKIFIAMILAFLGPVIFSTATSQIMIVIGTLSMIISFGFGLWGIRGIISSFFDKTNE